MNALGDVKDIKQRQIDVAEARAAHIGENVRDVAELEGVRVGEDAGVEVLIQAVLHTTVEGGTRAGRVRPLGPPIHESRNADPATRRIGRYGTSQDQPARP